MYLIVSYLQIPIKRHFIQFPFRVSDLLFITDIKSAENSDTVFYQIKFNL